MPKHCWATSPTRMYKLTLSLHGIRCYGLLVVLDNLILDILIVIQGYAHDWVLGAQSLYFLLRSLTHNYVLLADWCAMSGWKPPYNHSYFVSVAGVLLVQTLGAHNLQHLNTNKLTVDIPYLNTNKFNSGCSVLEHCTDHHVIIPKTKDFLVANTSNSLFLLSIIIWSGDFLLLVVWKFL